MNKGLRPLFAAAFRFPEFIACPATIACSPGQSRRFGGHAGIARGWGPKLASLTAQSRALPAVAGEELRKDGGNPGLWFCADVLQKLTGGLRI